MTEEVRGAICGGSWLFGRHRIACPTCGRETDFVSAFSSPWYGDILTCLVCGDAWSDGERAERPFRRGWRQEAIKRATARWENALPRDAYLAAIQAAVAVDLAPTDSGRATYVDLDPLHWKRIAGTSALAVLIATVLFVIVYLAGIRGAWAGGLTGGVGGFLGARTETLLCRRVRRQKGSRT